MGTSGIQAVHRLGDNSFTDEDPSHSQKLGRARNWVLVGGPPCQAYSTAGRLRTGAIRIIGRRCGRHFLYQQFLKAIAEHAPPVFLMENAEGLTSSTVGQQKIISQMLEDLTDPAKAIGFEKTRAVRLEYRCLCLSPNSVWNVSRADWRPLNICRQLGRVWDSPVESPSFSTWSQARHKGKPKLLASAEHRTSVKETPDLPTMQRTLNRR